MQVSSESDFELFSKKVKERTTTTIKNIEDRASLYVEKLEKKATQEIKQYSQEVRLQWEIEYHARERQEYKSIDNEINKKWNDFKREREKKLYEELRQRLEEIFPTLVHSFIACVSHKYEIGTLILPKPYIKTVEIEKFILQESEDERIVFKNSNLYIEYSIERIMEEIHNDIASSMNIEEKLWQV